MIAWRSLILRSSAGPTALAILALAIFLALTQATTGFNLAADRATGLLSSSVLIGVVASGGTALEAGRWTQSLRVQTVGSVRPGVIVRSVHALQVLLVLACALGIAVSAVVIVDALTGAYGEISVIWIALVILQMLVSAALGYAVGATAPYRWFVGPMVGVAYYGIYVAMLASPLPAGIQALFPANQIFVSVFNAPVLPALFARLAFLFALALLLVVLPSLSARRHVARSAMAVALLIVTIVSGGLVAGGNGQATTGRNPGDFDCYGSKPVLCLNPGYARAGEALQKHFAQMESVVGSTPLSAKRLEQNVEGIGDLPSPGARSVYLEQWAADDDLTFSVYRYVTKYGGIQSCSSPSGNPLLTDEVNSWLSGFSNTYGEAKSVQRTFLDSLTRTQAKAWFTSKYRAYNSCALDEDDFR